MATKIEPVKLHILKRKMELVWLLAWEGYEDLEIGQILGIERTWAYRLRKRMPKNWEPKLEKVHI